MALVSYTLESFKTINLHNRFLQSRRSRQTQSFRSIPDPWTRRLDPGLRFACVRRSRNPSPLRRTLRTSHVGGAPSGWPGVPSARAWETHQTTAAGHLSENWDYCRIVAHFKYYNKLKSQWAEEHFFWRKCTKLMQYETGIVISMLWINRNRISLSHRWCRWCWTVPSAPPVWCPCPA